MSYDDEDIPKRPAPAKPPSRARFLTPIGEPDELGDRAAQLTYEGERRLHDFLQRNYVGDSFASVSFDAFFAAFEASPDGFKRYGSDGDLTVATIADALSKGGTGISVDGEGDGELRARKRDALGVHYGKIYPAPRCDLIEGMVPAASVGIVVGEAGSLKTWFCASMVAALANGQTWLGRFGTAPLYEQLPDRAVYVNFDMPAATLDTRLVACGDGGRVGRCNFPPISPADPRFWEELVIDGFGPKLVIIDTLSGATPGVSEREATFALPLKLARRYANRHSAAVFFVHHPGKEGDGRSLSSALRGTSALGGDLDVAFFLEAVDSAGPREHRARVKCIKFRDDPELPEPFTLQVVDGVVGIVGAEQSDADRVLAAIRATPGVSASVLAKSLSMRKSRVLATLSHLGERVRTEGSGPKRGLYALVPESIPEPIAVPQE